MSLFGLQIDGGWIDDFSYVTAVAWSWARYVKRRRMPVRRSARRVHPMRALFCSSTAADFFSGLCLFPLCALAVSLFSDPLLHALLSGNRLLLSAAGVVALCSVTENF
ncbi:hypothetical protein SAMN05444165_3924 [Paraburkholderia phenazinium]|uniref:Uncharacterized protein n=2 Tax=Burkholderiaceae TaxID=119060 RepID=A0A1N6KM85_9BURK|nr:hypothetical protein SAMN05444165_3924 [Paraburkholderia phenazinium]